MHYEKKKRMAVDYCNICGQKTKLTWDHVPPKCCYNKYSIKVNSWYNGVPTGKYEKEFQSGIRFRSLCERCNNAVLGAKYDTELEYFTDYIKDMVMSSIQLPDTFNLSLKVNKICRAICGHMLAAKNFFDDESLIDIELRKYVLNEDYLPPKDMCLLYWIYPYSTICLIRDVAVGTINRNYEFPMGTISIMNAFPIAYIISAGEKQKCGLVDLFQYCSSDIEQEILIPIKASSCYFSNTSRLRPFLWPCNVSASSDSAAMLLANDTSIIDSKVARHSAESIQCIRKT